MRRRNEIKRRVGWATNIHKEGASDVGRTFPLFLRKKRGFRNNIPL